MSLKLDYRWHLRRVMANRGMYATTDLRPLLAERGFRLSQSQVYRLVAERPARLNLRVLMALIDILDCTMTDLIEPVPASGGRRPAAGNRMSAGRDPAEGERTAGPPRPKRANVLPE
ncbi:helix-turn-helix domain-containing protein [Streptosporangium sp. G11]|uniref:helix-turn-helix domain-containing protein n=1 Tax=Streptosporangium sp. G11 TaxID=3436926 RepID=UPI003EBCEA33